MADGELCEGLPGQDTAGIHGRRDAGAGRGADAELAEVVEAPAEGGAGGIQRARVEGPGSRDLDDGLARQRARRIDCDRPGGPGRAVIAELAEPVISPAYAAPVAASAQVWLNAAVIWVKATPPGRPLVSTATGTLE